jgi:acetyl esterase/lipase
VTLARSLATAGLVGALLASAFAPAACSRSTPAPTVQLLWPDGAPDALGRTAQDRPTLTVFRPAPMRANGAAVVVFPGGGYEHLVLDYEGEEVAHWLTSVGVTAFVVAYRHGPRYRYPTILRDGQRAVRTVRARAREWGVDPHRVGALGFSAGGHLAAMVGTRAGPGTPGARDPIDAVGSRPDFLMLVYPVITMHDRYTHAGSKLNLLGPAPDSALVDSLSLETQVTRATPPTFLIHTTDDDVVPVENTLLFYQALRAAGVPAEMHVYRSGPHGFGLAPKDTALSTWPQACEAWMRSLGLLERAKRPADQ